MQMQDDSTKIHSPYQDDFDNGEEVTDPIMQEQNDDPVETFGIPPEEFRDELDDLDIDDDTNPDKDDARERIEDQDQDPR